MNPYRVEPADKEEKAARAAYEELRLAYNHAVISSKSSSKS